MPESSDEALFDQLFRHLESLGYRPQRVEIEGMSRISVQVEPDSEIVYIGLVNRCELYATGHIPDIRMIQKELDLRPFGQELFLYQINIESFP
jgi:hypothetical protein